MDLLTLFRELLLLVILIVIVYSVGFLSTYLETPRLTDAEFSLRALAIPEEGRWSFEYPGEDGTLGTADDPISDEVLVLPEGSTVRVEVVSTRVPVSLYLPEFRYKQDGSSEPTVDVMRVPAREDLPEGSLRYMCTEYCGTYHAKMHGRVLVLSPDRFRSRLARLPRRGE